MARNETELMRMVKGPIETELMRMSKGPIKRIKQDLKLLEDMVRRQKTFDFPDLGSYRLTQNEIKRMYGSLATIKNEINDTH